MANMNPVTVALNGTDWALLVRQKRQLAALLNSPNRLFDSEAENLMGLLNWIDALQDAANEAGFPVEYLED